MQPPRQPTLQNLAFLLIIANTIGFVTWQVLLNNFAMEKAGFTINHIAAVMLPAALGFVWMISAAAVFLIGAAIAFSSPLLSQLIPDRPRQGAETSLHAPTSVPG